MEAKLVTFHNFFDNSSSQFYIPIYQREYSWDVSQITKLLEDLENILSNKFSSHFFGNVIYKENVVNNFISKQLIDGQQRITTFFLLLNCIKNNLVGIKGMENTVGWIKDLYLENKYVESKYKLKLKPEIDNTNIYELISENKFESILSDKKYKNNNIYKNYIQIDLRVKKWLKKYEINSILDIFNKTNLVEINIKNNDDVDAQKIFESINSTGLSLRTFDLIRNYVLMDLNEEEQNDTYSNFWLPFEKEYKLVNSKNNDKILRILIQFLAKFYVREKEIYQVFQQIFSSLSPTEIIEKMRYALKIYSEVFWRNTSTFHFDSFLGLQPGQNDLYATVFMLILEKHQNNLISSKEFLNSKKILSKYILLRKVSNFDTSSITRYFNDTLVRRIKDINEGIANFLQNELFEQINNSQMFAPSYEQMIKIIDSTNFYDLSICKVFLWYLENNDNKVIIPFNENLTIEHLAPQNPKDKVWTNELQLESETEYQNIVNNLGNLTLITDAANKSLGNASWQDKKNKLANFKHIKLNEPLLEIDNFTVNVLEERQKKLIKDFYDIFN